MANPSRVVNGVMWKQLAIWVFLVAMAVIVGLCGFIQGEAGKVNGSEFDSAMTENDREHTVIKRDLTFTRLDLKEFSTKQEAIHDDIKEIKDILREK